MPRKITQNLDGMSRTLLLTLCARGRASQRPEAIFRDEKAVEVVNRIDDDFSHLKMHRHDEVAVIIRMKKFDRHVRDHFHDVELVCDAHTPFAVWVDNLQLAYYGLEARPGWGIKHGSDVENWGADIQMLDERNYYQDDGENLKAFRWVRLVPALAKSSGIFHYRLSIQPW
jgi:hypothetical protein